MSNQANHLFIRKVACKPSAVRIIIQQDDRSSMFPTNTFGPREQIFQQFVFGGHIKGDKSMTDSRRSIRSTSDQIPVTSELFNCSSTGLHFDVTIHSLGCRALHDNVNRSSNSVFFDHVGLGITAEEMGDLLFGGTVRDLLDLTVMSLIRDREEGQLTLPILTTAKLEKPIPTMGEAKGSAESGRPGSAGTDSMMVLKSRYGVTE